jgi:hypothetical protein
MGAVGGSAAPGAGASTASAASTQAPRKLDDGMESP